VVGILNEKDGNQAILACFEQLPLAQVYMVLFCLVSIIFTATTYDSASYILATNATLRLHPSEDPPRWHRCFWSVALAVLPITLMYVGGLKVAQTAVLIVSLPILLVGIVMSISLIKSLNEDHG
jgi:BCCT family betaine/carnitine transporter